MAEFMLLFRGGAATAAPSPEQMQASIQKWADWITGIAKEGKLVGSQPLQAGGKQVKGPKKVVTDGPFAEGKEIVGGYLICKADSLDEAVKISHGCPILENEDGIVEVREIREMPR